jgi:hypothetical protein
VMSCLRNDRKAPQEQDVVSTWNMGLCMAMCSCHSHASITYQLFCT